jgi:hypothetical protein
MQSRMDSFVEASINIAIGFMISWALWLIVNPLFGLHASFAGSFLITVLYTITSFLRQYLIRRWLNGKIIWEEWLHRFQRN